jgi:hypothetical protein
MTVRIGTWPEQAIMPPDCLPQNQKMYLFSHFKYSAFRWLPARDVPGDSQPENFEQLPERRK